MREQIRYKSRREIEKLREAGRLAANALRVAARAARAGVTLLELDKLAETYIRKNGGTPNFKGYHGFTGTPLHLGQRPGGARDPRTTTSCATGTSSPSTAARSWTATTAIPA